MSKGRSRRLARQKQFGSFYEFKAFGNRMACAYCGDVRECVDHVPPIVVVEEIGLKKIREHKIDLITVPCCMACNNLLGKRAIGSYEERLNFVYNWLINKLESATLWSKDEIEELNGNLRTMIEARQRRIRKELIERLRGAEQQMANVRAGA